MKLAIFATGACALIVEYSKMNENLSKIKEALSDDGLVLIRGVEGYEVARDRFIDAAYAFSKLTDAQKRDYTPVSSYKIGWDRGIESFNGHVDRHKGSYYAHIPDDPGCNIWPDDRVSSYRSSYLKLAEMVRGIGEEIMLMIGLPKMPLQSVARGLDYAAVPEDDQDPNPFWCGEHRDHGEFTGLVSSVYIDPLTGIKHPEPDGAGLYVRGVKVTIPDDCMAFQVGETAQLISNSVFQATRHHVAKAYGLQRLTMAVFISPLNDYVIRSTSKDFPERFLNGMTYGEWQTASFNRYKQ